MSLQVWLPLNGNINNQGLINWTPIGTNITYVNGKIGKALNTGGITMPASVTEQVLNNNEFSYCCWLYVNEATGGTTGRPTIFGNSSMTAPNNRKFSLFQYPTCNDLHISWQNDVNTTYIGLTDTGAFPSYKWTHLAVVYKNPNVLVYLNGELWKQHSGVSNSPSFAFDTTLIHDSTYHYLDDVRLYNHALSPKEVKEISKGLCLHYRLDGIGQENLISSFARGGNTTIDNYKVVIPGRTTGSDTYFQTILSKTLEQNKQYVLSFDTEFDANNIIKVGNFNLIFNSWEGTNLGVSAPVIDVPRHYEIPFTCSIADAKLIGWDDIINPVCSTDIIIKNLKVEEGTVATPWLPNPNDAIYSTLGFNSKTEPDCSGYGNNGTKVGNIAASADTAKYSTSYQLSNGNYITSSTGVPIGNNAIMSINFWYNIPSGETIANFADLLKLGGSNFRTEVSSNGQNIAWYNYPIGTALGIGTKISGYDKWDMWTLTNDGTNIKTYLNGILFRTTAVTGTTLQTDGSLVVGEPKDAIKFKMSDLRIYATALSAADVLDLYQTGAAIDSGGNIYAYNFIEGGA